MALFNRFHAFQTEQVGWNLQVHTEESYIESLIETNHFCKEYQVYDNSKLIGVGFMDQVGDRASSIYFFYDPEYRERSLGTWSVISEIKWCQQSAVRYLHLGLWNESCRSLNYKNRFGTSSYIKPRTAQESALLLQELFTK